MWLDGEWGWVGDAVGWKIWLDGGCGGMEGVVRLKSYTK